MRSFHLRKCDNLCGVIKWNLICVNFLNRTYIYVDFIIMRWSLFGRFVMGKYRSFHVFTKVNTPETILWRYYLIRVRWKCMLYFLVVKSVLLLSSEKWIIFWLSWFDFDFCVTVINKYALNGLPIDTSDVFQVRITPLLLLSFLLYKIYYYISFFKTSSVA